MEQPDLWIFIRGLAREQGHWLDFLDAAEKCLGAPCIALDVLGTGEYFSEKSPSKIEQMREHLQQSKRIQGASKIGIVALSMGGMIALDWIQSEPDRISHAVLINTSSRLNPFWQRLSLSGIGLLLKSLLSSDFSSREAQILQCVSNNPSVYDRALNTWVHIQKRRPVSVRNIVVMLLAAARYQVNKCQNQSKLLFLASQNDRLVQNGCTKSLATFFNAPFILESQGAGHDLPLDNPQWVLSQLASFINEE